MINKKALLLFLFLGCSHFVFTQQKEQLNTTYFVGGTITATNNGISLIPSFSLNKPAALFDLSVGKNKLSFDPMFRFGMDGKPWAFIFWWHYKAIQNQKFSLTIGAHPSFVFRTTNNTTAVVPYEQTTVQRYFAWEAAPTLVLNKDVSIGIYYLGSHGLTKDIVQYTNFLALRSTIKFTLSEKYKVTFIPQAYFLKMDKKEGTYANATVILSRVKFPISISYLINTKINSSIVSKPLVWNIGLHYNFNTKFSKK